MKHGRSHSEKKKHNLYEFFLSSSAGRFWKSPKCGLLVSQGLIQNCLRLPRLSCLYVIMATAAVLPFSHWRFTNCSNCAVMLSTCTRMYDFYTDDFIENRSAISRRSVADQSPADRLSHRSVSNQSPIELWPITNICQVSRRLVAYRSATVPKFQSWLQQSQVSHNKISRKEVAS